MPSGLVSYISKKMHEMTVVVDVSDKVVDLVGSVAWWGFFAMVVYSLLRGRRG